MKKIICLVFAFFAMASTSNAQFAQISMTGDAIGGWGNDTDMTTTDGVIYKLENKAFTDGGAKFRQDHAWTNAWGAVNFPSGNATTGSNISVTAGYYDVTFNLTTKAYTFVPASNISVYGTAFGNVDVLMSTVDGINYTLSESDLDLGTLVFREDNGATNTWGNSAFPSGTATSGGTAINVTPGYYNIKFNKNTGVYSFGFPRISTIGAAKGGWSTDTDLTTTDGENYTLSKSAFTTGGMKFRKNGGWGQSWGGSTFPNGTGLTSGDIPVQAGNYVVSFNRLTGAYTFSSDYPVISLTTNGTDTDLFTTDGVTYTGNAKDIAAGNYQFRQANANDFVWGASAFPSGTAATYITTSISIPSGRYNISFNKTTGAYSFNYVRVGIIGSATPGGWDTETVMSTTDGINYRLNGIALTNNAVKFRQGNSWDVNWGSNSFPQGTGTNGGSDIPVNEGSTYNIAFNVQTGVYTFTDLMKSKVRDNQCGAVLTTLSDAINAITIPSAEMYRYEVTNGANVRTFETIKPLFSLTQLTGSTYGTFYTVRVAVKIAGTWRTYGSSCDIYSPTISSANNVPVTKMRASQCGATLATIGSPIHSELVYGAEAYRFQLTNGSTVNVVETTNYYFLLTSTAYGTYGTTYSVKTAAKVAGTWGNYGAACSISTPALSANSVPTTQLLSTFCNTTLAALNTKIGANTVYNADAYRFKIVKAGIETIYVSNVYNFRLSDAGIVATNGSTYAISVAARVSGTFGNYGASCNVTMPGSAGNSRQITENTDFSLVAYPNPSNSAFKLQVNGSNNETVSVLVFDMMGRQIENKVVNVTDIENISLGQNYSTGVYNVIVSQGMNTKTVRLVKN